MKHLNCLSISLLTLASVVTTTAQPLLAQSTVSGAAVISNGSEFMVLSGQMSLPDGFTYGGPTFIVPYANGLFDPPDILFPTTLRGLAIAPTSIDPIPTALLTSPNAIAAREIADPSRTIANDLSDIVSLIRTSVNIPDTVNQASASGSVSYSDGTYIQTITGEVTLQNGYFDGPLFVEQSQGDFLAGQPNSPFYPISPNASGLISSLVVSPGSALNSWSAIETAPNTINAAVAARLREATGSISD